MNKKIYVVTQESEDDGFTGLSLFATKDAAVKDVNYYITEHNDEEGSSINHVMWPERVPSFRVEVGSYTYTLATYDVSE